MFSQLDLAHKSSIKLYDYLYLQYKNFDLSKSIAYLLIFAKKNIIENNRVKSFINSDRVQNIYQSKIIQGFINNNHVQKLYSLFVKN